MTDNTQSSASKAALPEEVAGMVKRLRDKAKDSLGWRTYLNQAPTEHNEEELFLLSVATLLSALAARAQTAEAVAAKSREEALEEAAKLAEDAYLVSAEPLNPEYADFRLVDGKPTYTLARSPEEIAEALRSLKPSRTDSGRATEDDGATNDVAMISASPVAGKGNG